jgi:hypothetical protein
MNVSSVSAVASAIQKHLKMTNVGRNMCAFTGDVEGILKFKKQITFMTDNN